jgi:RecB family exonuclease
MFMSASHSEIETFTECERKHYYRYARRLESKQDSDTLVRGNVIHEVLSEYYLGRKLGKVHFEAMEHALPYIQISLDRYNIFDPDAMKNEVTNLLFWYWETYADDTWRIIDVEVEYKVQLTDDFILPVKIDLIVEEPGRGIGLIDHKVTYHFFNVDKIDLSPQLPRYMAAALELGMKIDFVAYNEIRRLETKENRADPSLKFRRTVVPLTPTKVVTIMREHMEAAERINNLKALGTEAWSLKVIRNPSACQYCNMKDLCDAELNDRDPELTALSFYKEREKRPVKS